MDWVNFILGGAFAIFVAIMAFRQAKAGRGGSYEERRDEWWEYSQQHVGEFQVSKPTENDSSEEGSSKGDVSEEASPEEG